MKDKKEMTARNTSVSADDGQSLKSIDNSIAETDENCNRSVRYSERGLAQWQN